MIPTNTTAINQAVAAAGNRKELTEKQEAFMQNFMDNGFTDAKQCAINAGYSPKMALSVVRSLKDEIMELAEMMMVEDAPRAVLTFREVMESNEGIPQASAKMDAAKTVLDRIGLGKKEKVDVNHNVSGGIFLIPAKQEIKVVEGEVVVE